MMPPRESPMSTYTLVLTATLDDAMNDALDAITRLFDKLGWPGIVIGLVLTYSYSILPEYQAVVTRNEQEIEKLHDTDNEMRYAIEDIIRILVRDRINAELEPHIDRMRGVE